ncbi:MAG: hypothetical protein QNJ65_21665 [Xenococcaceae cyanobacterium MO_234.B1]|nr:hypothetical protein [Xenococcaceae cyanobacterium MO_234.B1]
MGGEGLDQQSYASLTGKLTFKNQTIIILQLVVSDGNHGKP